jgi:hypothetical protein
MKQLPHNKYVYSYVLEWDDVKSQFTLMDWISDEKALRIARIINEDNEKQCGQKVARAGLCMRQRTYYNDDGTTRQENSYEPVRDEFDECDELQAITA